VNWYVNPLVIGFVSATFAWTASAFSADSNGAIWPSGSPTTSTPFAGSELSPDMLTVPMSEVTDISLSLTSGEPFTATNNSSASVPGST
jgi:hypothetical protein